eukprot:NODE_839_length_3588_cov_1.240183.p2 type:complete len:281 gc:universal NODE_839_length_3588_cov_1.240183:2647-1805(-)
MLSVNAPTITIFMLLGINYYIFFQSVIQSLLIFKNKHSLVFLLIQLGLFSTIIEVTASYMWLYYPFDSNSTELLLGFITCISWHLMIITPVIIYCIRIKTLNHTMQLNQYIHFLPVICILFQIPSAVTFIIAMLNYNNWYLFVVSSAVTTFVACTIEITLYSLLMKRIYCMFQYRQSLKKLMALELSASMALLIIIDIGLLIFKLNSLNMTPLQLPLSKPQMDNALRPLSYMLRLQVALRFFDELIDKVGRTRESGYSNMNSRQGQFSYAKWFTSRGSSE